MYRIPGVKVNFAVLLFLCCSLLFLTLCGKPDGPSSSASNTTSATPPQSPLADNKPHLLNELFTALKDPVISVLEIDANNDGSKDILLTTAGNEIYALVNQNGGTYIAKTLLSNQSIS
ncbi:MAG: hypothetical protein HZA48_11415 [Planctomycetes bacterium]|nr:hypothetical protein [Planctomycetota bacterium]